jgi:hypothetical protein
MLGSIREPRADVLTAFPTVGETSSPRRRAYFEEHDTHGDRDIGNSFAWTMEYGSPE